jgi:serine/threonine protein kinase
MIITIESCWLKTEIQLEYVRKVWQRLDPRLQAHFHRVLQVLQDKLQAALVKVDSVLGLKDVDIYSHQLPVKKMKTALLKSGIKQAIQDLENWQARFDPSWYLITLVADSTIDKHLQHRTTLGNDPTGKLKAIREAMRPADTRRMRQSIFIDGRSIEGVRQHLSWCTIYVSHMRDGQSVLLDTITYPPDTIMSIATTHVRDLARVLANADAEVFGLLACHGIVKIANEQAEIFQFQFVFAIPPGLFNPRTLRDLLLQGATYPLDQRFQLAKKLARSVTFVHTYGFVHKNIRPDTIVVFQNHWSVLGHSFLVGFERFRPAVAGSHLRGDSRWETNLYRHPRRQGSLPEDTYIMQHDIYSLGVCLLELGLWSSFVCPNGESMELGLELIEAGVMIGTDDAFAIKRKLVSMASDRLPGLMGSRYTNIVISCLRCLDPEETNLFGTTTELEDQDGIVVGVQYIEKVVVVHCPT